MYDIVDHLRLQTVTSGYTCHVWKSGKLVTLYDTSKYVVEEVFLYVGRNKIKKTN